MYIDNLMTGNKFTELFNLNALCAEYVHNQLYSFSQKWQIASNNNMH